MKDKDLIRLDKFSDKKDLPFFMRPLLHEKNRDRKKRDPHRHTYHEIIYFKSGEALQNIDDEIINLKTPNTFYLIERGQVHDFIKGKNMQGFLIRFDSELIPFQKTIDNISFLSIIHNISKVNTIILGKEDVSQFEAILNQLHYEYLSPLYSYGRRNTIVFLLLTLLVKLQRKCNEINSDEQNLNQSYEKKMYYKFLELLELNFSSYHECDFYAHELGLSNRKLTEITMFVNGSSSKKIIIDRIIIEAKRLLLYSQISSKEISFILGFESPSYFSRLFKNKTGESPNSYKKNIKSKENAYFEKR
ncbi:AraC family transcriptional regulator [Aquimarina macrocephali]|uniref:AraC family transcriptional regulator n=1 Tax=Aquimarina macrocephali TaxID=666563 RepID=UPI000464B8CC|nr:AraC family transcriptional regulator [Aquimarina macrocephali]